MVQQGSPPALYSTLFPAAAVCLPNMQILDGCNPPTAPSQRRTSGTWKLASQCASGLSSGSMTGRAGSSKRASPSICCNLRISVCSLQTQSAREQATLRVHSLNTLTSLPCKQPDKSNTSVTFLNTDCRLNCCTIQEQGLDIAARLAVKPLQYAVVTSGPPNTP